MVKNLTFIGIQKLTMIRFMRNENTVLQVKKQAFSIFRIVGIKSDETAEPNQKNQMKIGIIILR
ncbi:MAG: hypothetical protein EZS26_002575 [Candidatus Ordinivivax streblomastigis]|uniref:Uncharacterized protein n=1 Tax=Candidatus Ordinivivax streblomastigis TaxID=2540710 RepID=A0A5M8NWQ5_9BACT|nr:MAG: hypothetical protein EZS26_002575 [Candidatus Ordinivivax streblomastigis]